MHTVVAHYANTGVREFFYNGPVAARSALLTAGYIVQVDRDGYILQNPTTGDIVTLCYEFRFDTVGQHFSRCA